MSAAVLPRLWPLLFPLTYLAHAAEEYFGGFPAWSGRYLGFHLTPWGFLQLNIVAWTLMLCGSVLASRFDSLRWLVVPLAAVTFINGCAHAIASVVTASYSPGLVSGLVLWVPIAAVTLRRSHAALPRRLFWSGVGLGAALHAIVTGAAVAG